LSRLLVMIGKAECGQGAVEVIYEFTVEDMPVTVAVDSEGNNVHQLAPLVWKEKIAREHLLG
jgi:fumarate hydratase class I